MKIKFYLRFHTKFGESLWISDNGIQPESDLAGEAIPMTYLNDQFWSASIDIGSADTHKVHYKYILKTEDDEIIPEFGNDRVIDISKKETGQIHVVDTWNHAGEFENVFFSSPFQDILLKQPAKKTGSKHEKAYTHIFKVKAPLLQQHEMLFMAGSGKELNEWSAEDPFILTKEKNWWVAKLNLTEASFPISYKYGVYNTKHKQLVRFENGDNRLLHEDNTAYRLTYIHDGFARLPNDTWKGSGVAIPVFSLKSKNSFGTGEFNDIKLLVDWAKKTGLRLIQILPVNDTTATNSWADSYPYAAISAFALHPLYINLEQVAGKKQESKIKLLRKKQKQLNDLPEIDYETVMKFKLSAVHELFAGGGNDIFKTDEYKKFFADNEHWLVPYAVFCYLRDKYGTADYNQWKTHSAYKKQDIEKLAAAGSNAAQEISLQYFIQFHLHSQLKEAAEYAHKKGVVLKGDIPIGIYRHSCDAWVAPELYNMENQAGAPPDGFAIKGQNWGFPTYNWQKMAEDQFDWWRKRFAQMSNYFDAFRIDHILGFFRIWSIPIDSVEGIMGHFTPAIPVSITEFSERGIWFDHHRYCSPYITDEIVNNIFRELSDKVKTDFLINDDNGKYSLKDTYNTQRKVENYFSNEEQNTENDFLKQGLFDLISNLILFKSEEKGGQHFHFRFAMDTTLSFQHLDWQVQQKLKDLYIDYFFKRQDDFWKKEAMHKLPFLKRATNMLICGEDLGMVPGCVPDVMKQLGILSLEIQRMPKYPHKEFFHPKDAPYLSVITPSTHDMSTIRGWWEENREATQRFFNFELGQWGEAPIFCEAWICRAVILQHLYSPAIWSIFQLQDILGMSETLRREDPQEERINIPAIAKYYWRYRMHISLEDLIKQKEFNEELQGYIHNSGRN